MREKNKLAVFIQNFSYSFFANVLSTLISAAIVFVVPKFLSVEQYGYYQLYLFYVDYIGVSFFGFCDGIYLRAAGAYYNRLNRELYSAQFWLLGIYEILFYSTLSVILLRIIADADQLFVIVCVCAVGVFCCLRWFVVYLLQATARIKEYAIVTISEKCILVIILLPLILFGYYDFKLIILVDVIARLISFFISVYYIRDIVASRFSISKRVFYEIWLNVSSGFQLMLSSLCSMLTIGVARFFIQRCWDISTFGKVSLSLNVSKMVMTAINAVAVAIYPMLRRANRDSLSQLYRYIRVLLLCFVFGILLFYYPIQVILSVWLPQYVDSFRYAAILFPICVYESKMSLLVNTYYKTLRLEKLLMKCNLAALVLSVVLTVLSTLVLHSVTFAILSILICLVFRGIISELWLSKHITIEVKKDIVIELCMTVAFIICNLFFGFAGMLMYAGCYVLYLFIKKNDILETVSFIKSMR